ARRRATGRRGRPATKAVKSGSAVAIVAAAAAYVRLCWMAWRAARLSTSAHRYHRNVRLPGTIPRPQAFESEVTIRAAYGSRSESNAGMTQIAKIGQRQGPSRRGARM